MHYGTIPILGHQKEWVGGFGYLHADIVVGWVRKVHKDTDII